MHYSGVSVARLLAIEGRIRHHTVHTGMRIVSDRALLAFTKALYLQAAQSEAGKKGAAISASRPEEDRKAAGQKAAETRYFTKLM